MSDRLLVSHGSFQSKVSAGAQRILEGLHSRDEAGRLTEPTKPGLETGSQSFLTQVLSTLTLFFSSVC